MKAKPLLKFEEIPSFLQYNKYILTGYRPILNAKECLQSLFYFHNESGNIYSHLIGIPIFIYFLYVAESSLVYAAAASFLLCFCGSVYYHTFMASCKTCQQYSNCMCYDLGGIWISLSGTALPLILFGLDYHRRYLVVFGSVYTVIALLSLYYNLRSNSPRARLIFFGANCICRYSIFSFRHWIGACTEFGAYCHHLAFWAIFFGGIINVVRFPEKIVPMKWRTWWPVDFVFNSHQFMHLLTLGAAILTLLGNFEDFAYYINGPLSP